MKLQLAENKNCDNCTKCCDGTLSTIIFNHKVDKNNPCPFVQIDKGCSIYHKRPQSCIDFICGWRSIPELPNHLKPNICNMMVVPGTIDNESLAKLIQCGDNLSNETVLELLFWAMGVFPNVVVSVGENSYFYGRTLIRAAKEGRFEG